ncbi:unnamed protein product [Urochloa humidicola]
MASTSQPAAIGKGAEERKEEEALPPEAGNGSQLVMPEDGYEWKKYGQKFIKNIQKKRSYFRCRHKLCGVKKRVEWHPSDPAADLRVFYEGAHQHGSVVCTGRRWRRRRRQLVRAGRSVFRRRPLELTRS